MLKQLSRIAIFISVVVIVTNCKKFGKPFDTYFFTDIESTAGPLQLFVDGNNKGHLPDLKTSMSPDNDTIIRQALHLTLKAGKYHLQAKDSLSNVISECTLKFSSTSTRLSGGKGGQATSSSSDRLVTKFY